MTSSNEWVSTSAPYIRPRPKNAGDAWAAEAASQGSVGRQALTAAGREAAPSVIAEILGIAAGETVIARHRTIYADDVPVELAATYYPLAVAAGTALAEPRKIKGGAVTLLAELGYATARVREDITARMPTSEERMALELANDEPVLILARLSLDESGRPLQADLMVSPAKFRRLQYELKVT
ncbi:UTRA domain-containing protein [Streptomyces sp. NPDC012794]|uniref:UTRA domain-containing protein n=1 Tax=Streptomyces sp. NPDC012794 TaxID=3364850 RepID=UPI0036BA1413